MPLEQSDLETLTAWFPAERHEFLNGMTYITEDAITERLDAVDPAWQFLVTNIIQRGSTVIVTARMEVKGVVREGVGMEKIRAKADGIDTNEAEKSAVTDALKRCARLFGIGRYLLTLTPEVKDKASLAAWFKKQGTTADTARDSSTVFQKPPWWNPVLKTAIPKYYNGVQQHAVNSVKKLLADGVLVPDMSPADVLAFLDARKAS